MNRTRSTIWLITSEGSLIGVTVEKATGVLAWHKHSITGASVLDAAAITGLQDPTDLTFLLTNRGGNFWIEYFGGDNEAPTLEGPYTEDNNAVFLDFANVPIPANLAADKISNQLIFNIGDSVEVVEKGIHFYKKRHNKNHYGKHN